MQHTVFVLAEYSELRKYTYRTLLTPENVNNRYHGKEKDWGLPFCMLASPGSFLR
jgi:hypothetical protein